MVRKMSEGWLEGRMDGWIEGRINAQKDEGWL